MLLQPVVWGNSHVLHHGLHCSCTNNMGILLKALCRRSTLLQLHLNPLALWRVRPTRLLVFPKLYTEVFKFPLPASVRLEPGRIFLSNHTLWSLLYLQGMSEEAVRQTRSQKRALERDALPQSTEPSNSDSESKKPKLDPSEPTTETQTEAEAHPAVLGAELSRTRDTPKHEKDDDDDVEEEEEEQGQLPIPLVLPLAAQQVTNDKTGEPSSDNRTDCDDRVSQVKTELAADTRSHPRVTETKAASGALAGGEVKATFKVEVQTGGEQPVDMSTSRR